MAGSTTRLLGLALAALVLAGCGADSGAGPGASSTSTPAPATSTPREDLSMTSKPPSPPITVTGVVSEGVEAGCLVFLPSGPSMSQSWVLVGNTQGIMPGSTVSLRGYLVPDLMTTCQQGTPFRVQAVVPTG